jgi:hypothetical protein
MEFKLLESVCTIAASHEFAAIVTGMQRKGQSKNEPIDTQQITGQMASNLKQAYFTKASCQADMRSQKGVSWRLPVPFCRRQ